MSEYCWLLELRLSPNVLCDRLFVIQGSPTEVFPGLFKQWEITRLTFEVDTEPYAVARDEEVKQLAHQHGVEVVTEVSHTLFDVKK